MPKRDQFWDCVRGVAILLVVATHYIGGVNPVTKCTSIGEIIVSLIRQMACYGVPLFIFMAGYFVHVEKAEGKHWMREFVWPKAKRILIPYFIWSVLTILRWRPASLLNIGNFLYRDLLLGYGIGIGYYITLLLQFIVLAPFIVRCLRRSPIATFVSSVIVSIAGTALFYGAAVGRIGTMGLSFPVPFPGIFPLSFMCIYVLGLCCRMHSNRISVCIAEMPSAILVPLAILTFAVQVWDGCCWESRTVALAQFRWSVLLSAMALCAVCIKHNEHHANLEFSGFNESFYKAAVVKWLSELGRVSFLVYLTHFQVLIYFWAAAQRGWWLPRTNIVSVLFVLAFTTCIYVIVSMLSRKLLPNNLRKFFAFQ